MNVNATKQTPWHLWVVGVASFLWSCIGCYDYVMSQTRNADYMRIITEPYGIDTQVAVDYFDGYPIWADAFWAIGVWSAMAGSVLLLLRSRYAFHAFVISLVGIVGTNFYGFAHPLPGVTNMTMTYGMTGLITVVTILLIWYSRRQTAAGVLR